jgi:hypothetical protein
MSGYVLLFGFGTLAMIWWLLNLIVLVWYLLLPRRKVSTMCIYAGLLPFILVFPVVAFLAFGWGGMGSEAPSPSVFAYLGDVAFTFVLFFGGGILHLWFISVPCFLLIGYGIYARNHLPIDESASKQKPDGLP